jgi:hypothetical protein
MTTLTATTNATSPWAISADTTGTIVLQSNGTTALTLDTSQNAIVTGNMVVSSTSKGSTADGSIASINSFGFKNRLINGALDFWQRGTTFSNLSGYGPDRWAAKYNDCAGNYTRIALSDLVGFTYSNQIIKSGASNGSAFLQQAIETLNCRDLLGKKVTFSVWAKKTNATTQATHNVSIGVGLFTTVDSGTWAQTPEIAWVYARWTSAGLTSGDPGIQTAGSYSSVGTPTAGTVLGTNVFTTSWERYFITLTIPITTRTITCQVGSEAMVQNGGIEFTGMQLELGGQPTQFEYRPVGMELALCQRYYSIPLLNNEVDVYRHTGTSTGVPVFFKVSMRIAPTLALTLNSTVFGTINTGAGQGGLDGVSISTEGFALFVYTNSNPAQVGANVTAKATAELV